jgi:hypothetical protein
MPREAKAVGVIGAVVATLGVGPCALREGGSALVASRTTIESTSSFAGRVAVRSDFIPPPASELRALPSLETGATVRELAITRVPELAVVAPIELRVLPVVDPVDLRVAALADPSAGTTAGREVRLNSPSQEVTALFSQTEPQIIDDLAALGGNLSQSKVANVISADVAKTLQNVAATSESGITFEVLSGKLKFNSYRTVRGAKVSLGEINVYKVSLTLAGAVVACTSLGTSELTTCVKEAIAAVGDVVRSQMDINPTKEAKPICREISRKHRGTLKNSGACMERPTPQLSDSRREKPRKTAARMSTKR